MMFDPEKEVPSLELCKRLKELGYPQKDGGWYWVVYHEEEGDRTQLLLGRERSKKFWQLLKSCSPDYREVIKAPTVRELGEWLPHRINPSNIEFSDYFLSIDKFNDEWQISYRRFEKLSESFSAVE